MNFINLKGDRPFKKIVFNMFPYEFKFIQKGQNNNKIPEDFVPILDKFDFAFFHPPSSETFWVECKFLDVLSKKKIKLTDKFDYLDMDILEGSIYCDNIYVAIGIGWSQDDPKDFYWIPLDAIGHAGVYLKDIEWFKRSCREPIRYDKEERRLK